MIELLKNKHEGKSASIIASGPSAGLYDGTTDISIGVNGAAYLGKHFDYFLCGDKNSHKFDWFKINCSDHRVVAKLCASNDYQLYPKEFNSIIERKSVASHQQKKLASLICPVYPHYIFTYRWFKRNHLHKNNNYLMFRGTISCCAVQLAYIMGCTEIHLYGCTFKGSRKVSDHYFYDNKQKKGIVSKSQREVMEICLSEVIALGVKVYIHGNSTLKVDGINKRKR
jgi:hypothetical protein